MATDPTARAGGGRSDQGIVRRSEEFGAVHSAESSAAIAPIAEVHRQDSSQPDWETEQRIEAGSSSWSHGWEQRQRAGTATSGGRGGGGDDESASADPLVSTDWMIARREEMGPGLFGVMIGEPRRREDEYDGDDEDCSSPSSSGRVPTVQTTTMAIRLDDPDRVISEDSFTRRRERLYEWMRNRLGNGGGGGREGQEGTVARKPRVGDYHRSSSSSKMAAIVASSLAAVMDDYSCCSKLPDHLVESVLARLPVQSVFRFRAVCRAWNSLLYSPTFLRAYAEAAAGGGSIGHSSSRSVWFLVVTDNLGRLGRYGHRIVATYDPQCNNWHGIPLPAPLCNLNPYPTAADGGLVCYFVYENRLRTLFVCNPLTKSLRKLPLVLKTSSHISVLKMVMEDRASSSYKVFVAGMVPGENGNDSLTMEVYDSATGCWSTSGIIPARYPKRRPVYSNGVLYVRCSDQRSLLLTYDLKLELWSKIHAPLPHTLGIEELVQYQGHILLVGVLGEYYKIDSVCIWELVQLSNGNVGWKQVDSMPRDMFVEFFCDREYFECQEDERVLMKCCQYGDLVLCVAFSISHRGPFKVLAYDLAQKRWRRLPDSFKARECRTHKFIEGLIYEPRLDVSA